MSNRNLSWNGRKKAGVRATAGGVATARSKANAQPQRHRRPLQEDQDSSSSSEEDDEAGAGQTPKPPERGSSLQEEATSGRGGGGSQEQRQGNGNGNGGGGDFLDGISKHFREARRQGQTAFDNAFTKATDGTVAEGVRGASVGIRTAWRGLFMAARQSIDDTRAAVHDVVEAVVNGQPPMSHGGEQRSRGGGGGGRGMGASNAEERDATLIWQTFFERMWECADVGLGNGWITKEDFSEPFILLGMPAAAVTSFALASRGDIGLKLAADMTVTPADFEGPEDIKFLFEKVEQLKISMDVSRVTDEEGTFLQRASLLASSRECEPPSSVGPARKAELNSILSSAQRVAISVTQQAFYKEASEDFEHEIERRGG